jgi:hypothetical protein
LNTVFLPALLYRHRHLKWGATQQEQLAQMPANAPFPHRSSTAVQSVSA